LLQSLVQSGAIKARTKWKQIYPNLADDERYANMLGNPGSNPLELFWDIVDRLDQELDVKLAMVKDAVQKHRSRPGKENGKEDSAMDVDETPFVGPNTTFAEFETLIQVATNEMSQRLADDELSEVFNIVGRCSNEIGSILTNLQLRDQTLKKQADERRRVERKQRHLQDDLRYALKKLPDPLDISLSYEAALPLIEHLPEYKALDDDEGRRAAFMKFVKRQKVGVSHW
jgi:pre-mRNA-processing factor 40